MVLADASLDAARGDRVLYLLWWAIRSPNPRYCGEAHVLIWDITSVCHIYQDSRQDRGIRNR